MLQKRRLTVQPVDAAQFCGTDNSMVVSFLNGIDHLVLDPAATDQDDAQPLPSRVMAQTYAGAQLADTAMDTQRECVAEAAVSASGTIACRVTPLVASRADPTAAYPVRAEGPSKVVFLSGCQRLAEVRLGVDAAPAREAAPADPAACPMQCFRVASSDMSGGADLDVAAFMADTQTLCTCTPQLGKLQTMRFDEQQVCCMGPGRVGRAEVTVVLSSGVPVLCGMVNTALSGIEGSTEDTGTDEQQQQQQQTSLSSSPEAVQRAFAAANQRSNLHILHTLQLPAAATAAVPRRVAWSGGSTLWVIYADGSLVAALCAEATAAGSSAAPDDNSNDNEESQQHQQQSGEMTATKCEREFPAETTMTVKQALHTQLKDADGQPIVVQDLHVHADPRAPVLHIAFTSGTQAGGGRLSRLYFGTVRVSAANDDGNTIDASPPASMQWRLQWMPYDEQLYGVRFERGQFHVLTQSTRGGGPLYVATLPRSSPVHTSQVGPAAAVATGFAGLAEAIIASPENDLAQHCRTCEDFLRELHAAAQQMYTEDDAATLLHRLMQAQHALYALLRRQHESLSVTDLAPSESLPYRLLQRAARLYRQLSAYVLLLRLGVVDTVTRPLREVLRLEEATALRKVAQGQWTSLMRDTFRSGSVYQSAVSELAMWESPTQLCVDVLLRQLGLSVADPSCTMASVLSRMDTLTTEYALFILYYSYHAMGVAGDADVAVPPPAAQKQQCQWRESFLLLFGQSIELNVWAFACYAVDHGINPAAQPESEEAADAPPLFHLGTAVHHLGAPPMTDLLAPVLNGLANVAALDVLVHAAPSCLAVYTAAAERVPLSVSMRLLCVAVRIGSHRLIAALYEAMRGSPLLQDLAAQPLAFAALAARDVCDLRGWVEVGSPVAATIERTLQAAEDIHQRESVLIAFYILMQRYEEALQVCSAATAADATQAQRLQVVLSYLRSLLTFSSAAGGDEEEMPAAAPADVDPLLPLDSTVLCPWSPSALAAPLLETSMSVLTDALHHGAGSAGSGERGSGKNWVGYTGGASGASHSTATAATTAGAAKTAGHAQQQPLRGGGGGVGGSAPPNATRPPLFRPSTLLASVERSAGSRGASSPSPGSTVNQSNGY